MQYEKSKILFTFGCFLKKLRFRLMNKNQKIFGGVILVLLVIGGLCYAFYEKGKNDEKKTTKKKDSKDREDIKKNSKRIGEIEKTVAKVFKDNPTADVNSTIGHLAQERKDLFQSQKIRVIQASLKRGSEDALKALHENETSFNPEAVSDLIENSVETTLSNENVSNTDNIIPTQSSDSIPQPKKADSKELASEEELGRKLISALGQKELEEDLWKFHSKNSKGEYILGYEETKELISNICYHDSSKPTGKVFETKHERAFTLPYLMFQIYDRHKLDDNAAPQFAKVLIDNTYYYKGRIAKSIISNWGRKGKDKLRSELVANPHIILI